MKRQLTKTITCLTLAVGLNAVNAQQVLQPLTTFGPNGDGSLRAGDREYLTIGGDNNAPHQRSIAYNASTGNLLLVHKYNASGSPEVHRLNGITGEDLGILDTSFLVGGGHADFPLNAIGVAEDGAIYAGNLSSSPFPPQFHLYRWENESAAQQIVFPTIPVPPGGNVGDPSNGNPVQLHKRWGDTLAVRGSGINTEVLIASRGTLAAILRPTDATMTSFVSTPMDCPVPAGGVGYAIAFGPGNTFYGKDSDGNLYHLGYTVSGTVSNITTFSRHQFPINASAIAVDNVNNRMAAFRSITGPDKVSLFDVANRSVAPAFLDANYFVTTNNPTSVAALAFGGGNLYALQGHNGIMAFSIANGTGTLAPTIYAQPSNVTVSQGTNATLGVGVEGTAPISYQWFFGANPISNETNALLVISNAQASNAGVYKVVVSNNFNVVTSANATLTVSAGPLPTALVYEPFNYTAGSFITNKGTWFASTGTAGQIEAGSLSSPTLPDSVGNKFTWGTSGSFRIPTTTTTFANSIYFSYLFQAENLPASATIGQFSGFVQGTTSTGFGTKTLIRTNGSGGFNVGIAKGTGTTLSGFATNELAQGVPVFIVGRYTFGSGSATDDVMDLWVNPDPATFAATNPPAASVASLGAGSAGDLTSIDHFFFRGGAGNAGKMQADELRIGLDWASVTPIRQVTVVPQLVIQKSGSNVRISWPASVTGYVLEGTTSLSSPSWSTINHSTVDDENVVTIDAESGNLFVRLKK